MPWTQVCCQYDGSFDGFLCCVFESYVHKEEPVEFRTPEDLSCSLYPQRTIQTHAAHAQRVYRSLEGKLGREGRELFVRGFLTCLPERSCGCGGFSAWAMTGAPPLPATLLTPQWTPCAGQCST